LPPDGAIAAVETKVFCVLYLVFGLADRAKRPGKDLISPKNTVFGGQGGVFSRN